MFKYISFLFIFIKFTACSSENEIKKIFNTAVSENFSGVVLVASEGEIIFTGVNGKGIMKMVYHFCHLIFLNLRRFKTIYGHDDWILKKRDYSL